MMDLTSSPCPRAHINFTSAQSLFISTNRIPFEQWGCQRAVAVLAGGNDVGDGENVAIDVIRTQAFTAIDLRLLPYGNVSKSAT